MDLLIVARDAMHALKADDAKAFCDALKAFCDIRDTQPHQEGKTVE